MTWGTTQDDYSCDDTLNILKGAGQWNGQNNLNLSPGTSIIDGKQELLDDFFSLDARVSSSHLNNALMYIQSHKYHVLLKLWPSLLNMGSFSLSDYHGVDSILLQLKDMCKANGIDVVVQHNNVRSYVLISK